MSASLSTCPGASEAPARAITRNSSGIVTGPGASSRSATIFLCAAIALGFASAAVADSLRGTVLSRAGHPIARAWVSIVDRTQGPGSSARDTTLLREIGSHALTDSSGRFEIPGLTDSASYSLAVGADGFHGDWQGPFGPLGRGHEPVIRLVPRSDERRYRHILVHVVDPNGEPLGAVHVDARFIFDEPARVAFPDKETTTSMGLPEEFTGPTGDASFIAQEGGTYAFEAIALTYAPSIAVGVRLPRAGTGRCTIRMARGATLRGTVVLPGRTRRGPTLTVQRLDDANMSGAAAVEVDSTGRYVADGLTPNSTFAVYAGMRGNPALGVAAGVVAHTGLDGSTRDVAVLRAGPAHEISGRLVASDRRPIPSGALIAVRRAVHYSNHVGTYEEYASVHVDAEGKFRIRGVPAQSIELEPLVDGLIARPADLPRLRWDAKGRRHVLEVNSDVRDLVLQLVPSPPPPPSPSDDTTPDMEAPAPRPEPRSHP